MIAVISAHYTCTIKTEVHNITVHHMMQVRSLTVVIKYLTVVIKYLTVAIKYLTVVIKMRTLWNISLDWKKSFVCIPIDCH